MGSHQNGLLGWKTPLSSLSLTTNWTTLLLSHISYCHYLQGHTTTQGNPFHCMTYMFL